MVYIYIYADTFSLPPSLSVCLLSFCRSLSLSLLLSTFSNARPRQSDDDNDSGLHRRKQKLATSRTEDLAPVPEDSTGAVSEEGLQDNTLAGSGERVPGRKVLLPTPVATTTSTGEREWAGGEGRRDEDARRKGKATKWTGKWDQKRDTA